MGQKNSSNATKGKKVRFWGFDEKIDSYLISFIYYESNLQGLATLEFFILFHILECATVANAATSLNLNKDVHWTKYFMQGQKMYIY